MKIFRYIITLIFITQSFPQSNDTVKVGKIMGVGDSMTLIEYLPKENRWLEEVSRRLGVECDNQARGGWKLSNMIADSTTWQIPESWDSPKIATVHPVHNDFPNTDTSVFRNQLNKLFDMLERRNFTIIAMTTAKYYSKMATDWGDNLNRGQIPYNHVLREVANQRGAYLLDLWEVFDQVNKSGVIDWMEQYGYDRHYNEKGCEIVEEALYNFILDNFSSSPDTDDAIDISIKCFLEGNYNNGLMSTYLNELNLLPNHQPYNTSPWNYSGSEIVEDFSPEIVDWVLIELRSEFNSPSANRRAALLKSDGNIVELNGVDPVRFLNTTSGEYFIVIYHRNHIPVISSEKQTITNNFIFDFTTSLDKAFGIEPMADLDGIYCLFSGDSDSNGIIDESDFLRIEENLFNTNYNSYDLDLNGVVNVVDYGRTNNNYDKQSQLSDF